MLKIDFAHFDDTFQEPSGLTAQGRMWCRQTFVDGVKKVWESKGIDVRVHVDEATPKDPKFRQVFHAFIGLVAAFYPCSVPSDIVVSLVVVALVHSRIDVVALVTLSNNEI